MAAIRITIGEMPRLLRSFVEGLLNDDLRFEFVPAESPAEVLLVAEGEITKTLAHSALRQAPDELGIVGIAPDGGSAAVVRVSTGRRALDGDPCHTLAHAILAAAAPQMPPDR